MKDDVIQEQITLCDDLTDEIQADGVDLGTAELLDYLGICGFKLKRLVPSDFDAEGVSVVSRAYFKLVSGIKEQTGEDV